MARHRFSPGESVVILGGLLYCVLHVPQKGERGDDFLSDEGEDGLRPLHFEGFYGE